MAERTDEREVDVDELLDDDLGSDADAGTADDVGVDVEGLTGEPDAGGSGSRFSLGLRDRIGNPLAGAFSLRSFGVTLALTTGLMLAFSFFVPFIPMSGIAGIFLAALGLGLLSGRRRYLELAVSGAGAAALATVFNYLVISLVTGNGSTLAMFGAGAGAVAALLGHYFGRDLRDGLTRDV